MAKNYVQSGERRTWTNATGVAVSSGDVVVVGSQLGIALVDIADGASGEIIFEGQFTVPKISTAVIAHGEMVVWIAASAEFDASIAVPVAGDVSNAAIAAEAAGNGVATIDIQLANRLGVVA